MTTENMFETTMKPPRELGGARHSQQEVELARIELANRLIPDHRHQNTEIKHKTREILAALDYLANQPFMISAMRAPASARQNMKNIVIEPLKTFLEEYYLLGVAMGRKGRMEAVKVASAAMQDQTTQQDDQVKKSILIH